MSYLFIRKRPNVATDLLVIYREGIFIFRANQQNAALWINMSSLADNVLCRVDTFARLAIIGNISCDGSGLAAFHGNCFYHVLIGSSGNAFDDNFRAFRGQRATDRLTDPGSAAVTIAILPWTWALSTCSLLLSILHL